MKRNQSSASLINESLVLLNLYIIKGSEKYLVLDTWPLLINLIKAKGFAFIFDLLLNNPYNYRGTEAIFELLNEVITQKYCKTAAITYLIYLGLRGADLK